MQILQAKRPVTGYIKEIGTTIINDHMKSYKTLNILSVLVAAMLLASCTEVVSEAETSGTEIIETSETTVTETSVMETETTNETRNTPSVTPVTTPSPTPTAIPESLSLQEQDLSSYVADIGGSSVYHVPQLLIEGEYASQVNAEILGIYAGYAQEQDRHYTGSEYIAFLSDGGCLSLVFVEQGIWDDDVYHVYNIDVNTGSRVTNEQIAEMAGVADIGQAASAAVMQYIDRYMPVPLSDEQMEYTLSEENLNADMMIGLTSESEMFFVSEVGSLGGASYYYEIYDEDGNDLLHLDFWVAW